MKLNNSISTPLYDQIKQSIMDAIDKGTYKQGEKLPNETEFCEFYGVSRITVRRAILELGEEGFLERKQGKGTFVTRKKIERELVSVDGFTDFSKYLGKTPSKRILVCEEIKATSKIAETLKIAIDSPVLRLVRLMYINEVPFTLDEAHYSLERFPRLTEHFLESASTYEAIKKVYNVNLNTCSSHKTITVTPATGLEAEYLTCEIGDTLFNIEKIVFDENKIPIHTSNFKTRTELIALTITT
ncbi:UTRA domain-containing protein [Neobacillus vireti]|uniref:UTRA domain-containing protein n=1 Tax=Neobacillus vireti TaxID=220686 RepID=UPI002FFE02EA